MGLTTLNGYTAGISVSADDDRLFITNSGTMDITTTKGGENIRFVSIYAQFPFIEDGNVKRLPSTLQGDAICISTSAADGFPGAAICSWGSAWYRLSKVVPLPTTRIFFSRLMEPERPYRENR